MILPRNTNANAGCAAISSSGAFQRTTGNTTHYYVLTFESVSDSVRNIWLNKNQTADILRGIDALCGAVTPGNSTTLCLNDGRQSPCKALVTPSSVASIAQCPNVGGYIAQSVIPKNADTFYSGIYSIVTPLNQTVDRNFDGCLMATFGLAIRNQENTVIDDMRASNAASTRPASKKLGLLTCALVGASLVLGTL